MLQNLELPSVSPHNCYLRQKRPEHYKSQMNVACNNTSKKIYYCLVVSVVSPVVVSVVHKCG